MIMLIVVSNSVLKPNETFLSFSKNKELQKAEFKCGAWIKERSFTRLVFFIPSLSGLFEKCKASQLSSV